EAVLREAGPLTLAELAQRLPSYYAFDAARVALDALVDQGRVAYTPPDRRRGGHGTYRVVAPPAPTEAPVDHAARCAEVERLMRAAGDALTEGPAPHTGHARLRPGDVEQLLDDAQAWLAARSDPAGAAVTIYAGAVAR
ncbi:MAG: hypothetical protein KC613_15830, partial [Myxococcales bacterium]|nr:hypothetical protein [Myxococcales bacterium]